jgi:hypothetical protein
MRQSHRQARKKGKNQRIPIQQGVPGERVCKRKKNGGEIIEGGRGERKRCRRMRSRHMWNGCSEMREKRKERRRKVDKMEERDMEEEGKNRKRKGWEL